jgi:hypothetical protein
MSGKTSKVRMVELISPPITTIASGFCVSEPMPIEIAADNKPVAAIKAVITTGRILDLTPSCIACRSGIF